MGLLFLRAQSHKSTNAASVAAAVVLSFSPFSPNTIGGRADGEKLTISFPVAYNDISRPLIFHISGFFLLLRAAMLRQEFTTEISLCLCDLLVQYAAD